MNLDDDYILLRVDDEKLSTLILTMIVRLLQLN